MDICFRYRNNQHVQSCKICLASGESYNPWTKMAKKEFWQLQLYYTAVCFKIWNVMVKLPFDFLNVCDKLET